MNNTTKTAPQIYLWSDFFCRQFRVLLSIQIKGLNIIAILMIFDYSN